MIEIQGCIWRGTIPTISDNSILPKQTAQIAPFSVPSYCKPSFQKGLLKVGMSEAISLVEIKSEIKEIKPLFGA